MSLLHADGFDLYASAADMMKTGYSRTSTLLLDYSTNLGRYGGGCLTFNPTASANGWLVPCSAERGQTLVIGFAYYLSGGPNANVIVASTLFSLSVDPSGVLTFIPESGSSLSTGGSVVPPETWVWIEMKVRLGTNATDGSVEVRVNDVTYIVNGAIDTHISSTARITNLRFSGPNGATAAHRLDDLVIMNTEGTSMNDFIGDSRIDTLLPTASGGASDWTASAGSDFQCVDDALHAANDDTDYISAASAGDEARFAFADLPDTPDHIDCVQVRMRARKQHTGTRTMRGLINSNGNELTGPERGLTTEYYWRNGGAYPLDPDGNVAWTETAVNAIEAGVEVVL